MNLVWMARPTGQVIRRIQTDRSGELVHVDLKKLGGAGRRSSIPSSAAVKCLLDAV